MQEKALIFDNINKFRRLLKEDASPSTIEDAINDREILYIYYDGDNTVRPGYRTIEPYALGNIITKDGAGDLALRAWEQAGASDSFRGKGKWARIPPRMDHEKFINKPVDGKIVPGWRLFKLSGIQDAKPTGMNFPLVGADGKIQPLRPLYNPNDQQLSVKVSVKPPSQTGDITVTGTDSIQEPDKTIQKVFSPDVAGGQAPPRGVTDQEMMMVRNVMDQWKDIKDVKKKSPKDYILIHKPDGRFEITPRWNEKKFDPDEVVGNVFDLYHKYSQDVPNWKDMNFFEKQKALAKAASRKGE